MEQSLTTTQFWTGVSVLIRNFHAVNKQIFACMIKNVYKIERGIDMLSSAIEPSYEQALSKLAYSECQEPELQKVLEAVKATQNECDGVLISGELLCKKFEDNIGTRALLDFTQSSYCCLFNSPSVHDFRLRWLQGEVLFEALSEQPEAKRWLEFVLKPKFMKWCTPLPTEAGKPLINSLQLVDANVYNEKYKELKRKYAEKTMKYWEAAKESTDAQKFVYEDMAIAAYLISLWQRVGAPRAFADLGCGNGLLVYLLNAEGFPGYGYDVRARKIWAHYDGNICLFEQTIEPDRFELPEDVDWLIGNHSDELSPWLPVLAARARYQMCYFLLPCCAYELSGEKYQRRNTKTSGYQDFYAYLQRVSEKCGFKTLKDRLKIPSTKRLALIGVERVHPEGEYSQKQQEINEFVEEERRKYGREQSVKLRKREEKVRNCTQIDRQVLEALVLKIFQRLLMAAEESNQEGDWRPGGCLALRDIASGLTAEDLAHIKAECGGVKTLLRNRHEIFEFRGGDVVGIRRPQGRVANKTETLKKRNCFFQRHHPDGCALSADDCTFIHV